MPLAVGDARIIEAFQLLAHASDRGHDRATAGLGGMSGEDGMDLERRDERIEALAPDLCTEFGHRCRQRLWKRLRTRVALAQNACPVMLLGKICQMEVAGEGAGHLLGPLHRP